MPDADALGEQAADFLKQRKRVAWNPISVLICLIVPLIVYAHVCAEMSSRFRHSYFYWAMLYGPGIAIIVTLIVTYMAYRKYNIGYPNRQMTALAGCMWFAIGCAIYWGESHYRNYGIPYFTYEDMASYTNIDPARDKGRSYMDAGQVYFKESVVVGVESAMALQNVGLYCIAPILGQPLHGNTHGTHANLPPSGSIDFWAVGQDCCEPNGQKFSCGAVDKPFARSGLRLLRNDVRPYYEMAVQQWNAWQGLPTKQALFFHWVEDPLALVDQYIEHKHTTYAYNFAMFTLFVTIVAMALLWGLLNVCDWP
jgi:hypothetical protein